jgi:hypothetical protein
MPGGWISRGAAVAWPPRSPDLSHWIFFPWRYVKNIVHKVRNHDLQQLKAGIRKAVFTVTHNVLRNAWTEASII